MCWSDHMITYVYVDSFHTNKENRMKIPTEITDNPFMTFEVDPNDGDVRIIPNVDYTQGKLNHETNQRTLEAFRRAMFAQATYVRDVMDDLAKTEYFSDSIYDDVTNSCTTMEHLTNAAYEGTPCNAYELTAALSDDAYKA